MKAPSATPSSDRPAHPVGRVHATLLPWRLPEPVGREVAVPLRDGGSVVVAGGLVAGDSSTSATYRLALATGRSTPLGPLPVAVHDAAGAWGGRPLVVGGGNVAEQAVVQGLSASGHWQVVGRLPSPRSDLSATSFGGRMLVLGGYDGRTAALADVLTSKSGTTYTVVGRLALAVRYAAVARARGAVWVFGGERNGVMVDTVQRVDAASARTTVAGRLPHALGEAAAVTFGDRVLLMGGRTDPSTPTSAMWWFNPRTRTFRRAGRLPTPLADSVAVMGGDRAAYLIGGETPTLSDRVVRVAAGLGG